jgi:diaminohydroxyphosphoribosylaminopyrimidine deaminase / 5-amino-6-(5-phosphoribosylamino)uracil reductase
MIDRPAVTVSFAQSIDGRIATTTGDSQWISGDATLKLAHTLRAENEGIVAGIGTVLKDDPELTCRLDTGKNPARFIFDSNLRIPLESKIVRTAADIPTVIFVRHGIHSGKLEKFSRTSIRIEPLSPGPDGLLCLEGAMAFMRREGIKSVLVEGGGHVITSFLKKKFVDRLIVVIAPMVIGTGIQAVNDLNVRSLSEALRPSTIKIEKMGNDVVWEMTL